MFKWTFSTPLASGVILPKVIKNKIPASNNAAGINSYRDPARIQTWNLLIRSQILYSVELRGHFFVGGKNRAK